MEFYSKARDKYVFLVLKFYDSLIDKFLKKGFREIFFYG